MSENIDNFINKKRLNSHIDNFEKIAVYRFTMAGSPILPVRSYSDKKDLFSRFNWLKDRFDTDFGLTGLFKLDIGLFEIWYNENKSKIIECEKFYYNIISYSQPFRSINEIIPLDINDAFVISITYDNLKLPNITATPATHTINILFIPDDDIRFRFLLAFNGNSN